MTQYIGLGHYSRTGKDSLARFLVGQCYTLGLTARRISFASKLKQVAHDLYGWAGLEGEDFYNEPANEHLRQSVLPALGMTPVDIWVKLGTDAIRRQVYDGTWVDYVLNTDHQRDVIVIPDVRFPNEIEALRRHNAILVKVVRPGYGPLPTVADQALVGYDGWDHVVGASGDLKELEEFAIHLSRSIKV